MCVPRGVAHISCAKLWQKLLLGKLHKDAPNPHLFKQRVKSFILSIFIPLSQVLLDTRKCFWSGFTVVCKGQRESLAVEEKDCRKCFWRNRNHLLNAPISNLNWAPFYLVPEGGIQISNSGISKTTQWIKSRKSEIHWGTLKRDTQGRGLVSLSGMRFLIYDRISSINSSELVIKQKLFFLFRSSSTSRTVSSKSSCAIRKPPVISDEPSSVTVHILLSLKGYFQHRDIDPQSWSFMSPSLRGHLDPQHWQRDGEQDLLHFFHLSLLQFHPPSREISCQLMTN